MPRRFRPFSIRPFGTRSALPALLCAVALGGCQSTPHSEQPPPPEQPEPRPEQTATEPATRGAEQPHAETESAATAAPEDAPSGAAASAASQPASRQSASDQSASDRAASDQSASDPPASDRSGASQAAPTSAAGATANERVQALDRELEASYDEHDALLREQQANARADAEAIAAQRTQPGGGTTEAEESAQGGLYEGLPGFGAPPPQGEDSGAEGEGETATAQRNGEPADNGGAGGDREAARGARGAASNGQLGGATVPEDIPDGRDDDIVARQLREAAQMEKDPQLREKLWDEYRKYKNQQATR